MLKTEYLGQVDGMTLHRTYSDEEMMIRQDETGELYEEAVDPDFMNRTYTETDIPIHTEEPPEEGEIPEEVPEEEPTEPEDGGTGSTIPIKPSKKY